MTNAVERNGEATAAADSTSTELQARLARARQVAATRLGRPFLPLVAEGGLAPLDSELNRLLASIIGDLPQQMAAELEAEAQQQAEAQAEAAQQQAAPQQGGAAPAFFPQPPDCAFLRPGQQFEGKQRVAAYHGPGPKQEHWEVSAAIQHYDAAWGVVAGTMQASNVPDAPAPVTTFFEGEVIDNVNHTFYTADWDACCDTDFFHWSKFESFKGLHAEVVRHAGRCPSLAAHPFVYMRWKEQFFVAGSECRLTIAGFYYLCLCRVTGEVSGFYFDPTSSPDQQLRLAAVRAGAAGFAFPAFELA